MKTVARLTLILLILPATLIAATRPEEATVEPGQPLTREFVGLEAGQTYRLLVSLRSGSLAPTDRASIELIGPGAEPITKTLHAGDPDLTLTYRPTEDGLASLHVRVQDGSAALPVLIAWDRLALGATDELAIEAEPNNDWQHANPLALGRDVYGSADDVDYLDNPDEGRSGLDWFRFQVDSDQPILVYFQLDLLDRDVSANLRVYSIDPNGQPVLYESGKDPMEIVHDRERERYSKHISRTFNRGTYYLEVNANHPSYVLRTRVLPIPPYDDPTQAVEAGMHYIMNVGDAWFAQIPREGNIYARASNLHDTATRCTACHPAIFSTEATLTAHRFGYPIRSKDNFQYVIDRLYNSMTPLYGTEDLAWQRYIAIPLQSQGMGGGILMDFEREVSGVETPTFGRFGPFLRTAWAERSELPADEVNGVVPLDSKFGLAWRDWRVLDAMAQRGGGPPFRDAARNIARLLADPASEQKIETLQDRIHRIYGWWLTDRESHAERIHDEAEALLALQNNDGGWHEVDSKRGPSAVYTTGQLVWTLLEVGYAKDDPRIVRALRYLLSQQQAFGGWFQTTTHENFRTPMRETRYAVMALAEAFPKTVASSSWGNRDDGPARLPRTDTLVQTLDDLENLWDVPEADRAAYARALIPFLDHTEPLVRAHTATCLGRLGRVEAVEPLVARLDDPSKMVWRAAASSLRRLGNAGLGVDAILGTLQSPRPLVRRGATRIFAYQFYGMDDRPAIALRLLQLTDDPDLWTRLQALKALRQWFYRTAETTLQRRIVFAYLSRMADETVPVVRKNLAEGMYIMLDENLGGGVSIQKNIAQLPEPLRPRILAARAEVERAVLLKPLLSALESGNERQREAILRSFDGSFFKGRSYARRPTNMVDVGNDREFGFLYEPPSNVLDRAFTVVFHSTMPADMRRQAIQLARFFLVPGRTASPVIQGALLKALDDPDPEARSAAGEAVAELSLRGVAANPGLRAGVVHQLQGSDESAGAIVRALTREPDLVAVPEVLAALQALLPRESAAQILQPLLIRPEFTDAEVLDVLVRGWDRARDPSDRLGLVETLLARRSLIDVEEPSEAVKELLRTAIHDPSTLVRERTFSAIRGLERLWTGRASDLLVLSALTDDSPAIRRLGLSLAESRPRFWQRPDAREALLRLLIDPDARVREAALAAIETQSLVEGSPEIARRVKTLGSDPALKIRAEAALRSGGFDPAAVVPDVALARPRLLSLATFREKVNPVFYRNGDDGYACARCHANHSILRIAEADPAKGFTDEQVMINYSSALKVINLGDPESSLILRKPRSPQGQGEPDPSSPTGLTHVGGPRWEDTDHPAYQTILGWLREASDAAHSLPTDLHPDADGYAPDHPPALAADGDLGSFWITEYVGARPDYPHDLTIDLGSVRRVDGLLYVPRQDRSEGRVQKFEVALSDDGRTWTEPVARGSWPDEPAFQLVPLPGHPARFVRLRGLSEVAGRPLMAVAELSVDARDVRESEDAEDP